MLLVSAKLDSSALVHDYASGASAKTGLVLALAIAHALSQSRTQPLATLPKHVVFGFWDAEQWGFAGSSRFAQDLGARALCTGSNCTNGIGSDCTSCRNTTDFTSLTTARIEGIVELDTVGYVWRERPATSTSPSTPYYMHVDEESAGNLALMSALSGSATPNVTLASAFRANLPKRLPPASAMSFLKRRRDIPTVVVADYEESFSNR